MLTKLDKVLTLFREEGILNTLNYLLICLKGNLFAVDLESYFGFKTDLLRDIPITEPSLDAKVHKFRNQQNDTSNESH